MYSRSLKATAKVQGASIISLLQNQYGESGLFKVILVKIRKTCNPLVVFRPFSLLCGVRFVNSISNLPLVSRRYVAAFCVMSYSKRKKIKPKACFWKERLEEHFESMSFKFAWFSHKLYIELFHTRETFYPSSFIRSTLPGASIPIVPLGQPCPVSFYF